MDNVWAAIFKIAAGKKKGKTDGSVITEESGDLLY